MVVNPAGLAEESAVVSEENGVWGGGGFKELNLGGALQ